MPTSPPGGLRERKKRHTRDALESAAVELALEHGWQNVTVDMIVESVQVSRSTFFNYFHSLQAAVLGPTATLPEPAVAYARFDAFAQRAPLALALLRFGIDLLDADREFESATARRRQELYRRSPELRAAMSQSISTFQTEMAALVEAWLSRNPQRRVRSDLPVAREALATTAAAIAIATVAADTVYSREGTTVLRDEDLDSASALIAAIVAAG